MILKQKPKIITQITEFKKEKNMKIQGGLPQNSTYKEYKQIEEQNNTAKNKSEYFNQQNENTNNVTDSQQKDNQQIIQKTGMHGTNSVIGLLNLNEEQKDNTNDKSLTLRKRSDNVWWTHLNPQDMVNIYYQVTEYLSDNDVPFNEVEVAISKENHLYIAVHIRLTEEATKKNTRDIRKLPKQINTLISNVVNDDFELIKGVLINTTPMLNKLK